MTGCIGLLQRQTAFCSRVSNIYPNAACMVGTALAYLYFSSSQWSIPYIRRILWFAFHLLQRRSNTSFHSEVVCDGMAAKILRTDYPTWTLQFSHTCIPFTLMEAIAQLLGLEKLSLRDRSNEINRFQFTLLPMLALAQLKKLKCLNLSNSTLTYVQVRPCSCITLWESSLGRKRHWQRDQRIQVCIVLHQSWFVVDDNVQLKAQEENSFLKQPYISKSAFLPSCSIVGACEFSAQSETDKMACQANSDFGQQSKKAFQELPVEPSTWRLLVVAGYRLGNKDAGHKFISRDSHCCPCIWGAHPWRLLYKSCRIRSLEWDVPSCECQESTSSKARWGPGLGVWCRCSLMLTYNWSKHVSATEVSNDYGWQLQGMRASE